MDIQDVARALRHGWWLLLAGVACGVAVAAVAILFVPVRYSSSVQLTVAPTTWSGTQAAYEGSLYPQQRLTSYAHLLTSGELASRVVADLRLDVPPGELARTVSAAVVPKSAVIEVTVTAASPVRARDVATALAGEFTRWVTQQETRGAGSPLVRVATVQAASSGTVAVSPQTGRDLALGGAVGLVAGLVGAVARRQRLGRVMTADDVSGLTGSRLIGVLDSSGGPLSHLPLAGAVDVLLGAGPGRHRSPRVITVVGPPEDDTAAVVTAALSRSLTSSDGDLGECARPTPRPGADPATGEPGDRQRVVLVTGLVTSSAALESCVLAAPVGSRRRDLASAARAVRSAGGTVLGVVLVGPRGRWTAPRGRRYRYAADPRRVWPWTGGLPGV